MSSNELERWGSNGIDIDIVAPRLAPILSSAERDKYYWRSHDVNNSNSINAVSYGFLATAVLISMFLVMAIFEKFFMPKSSSSSSSPTASQTRLDLEAQMAYGSKPDYPSPKMREVYAREVTVIMPGDEIPSFIAHPAPASPPEPCAPTRINLHLNQHNPP